ncbi:MAG TPA: tetratricopeptide repeat protein [Longimicrobiaceae bacterium]|nr:tetratricopeptide repeat protein [Longimicrobiaceae bacterium]
MLDASTSPQGEGDSALRVLNSARDEIEALRNAELDQPTARGLILRVSNAIDRSLRRLLRDHEGAELSLRLKALAPDELRSDEVLAELRRRERVPMDLAAAVHELFDLRGRLEAGGEPVDQDRVRAVRVADHLTREIEQPRQSPAPKAPAPEIDEMLAPPPRRDRLGAPIPIWAIAAVVVLVLGAATIWALGRGSEDPGMEQGVTLFRSGAYADAAQHFWRYAEAHPDDATPHLYLARIHRRMDRPDLAADAIRQAQELAPQDPAVHRELGFLLLDTGQPGVAVTRFREAIALDSASTEGWVGLVRGLRESGRAAEIPAAIADAPADARALLTPPDSL